MFTVEKFFNIFFQWGWTDMEELLQCPVCFESPKGIVEQCISGHHICSDCKPKVDSCPLCKCNYTGTRNFVVEELMRNLETIKVCFQLLHMPITLQKSCMVCLYVMHILFFFFIFLVTFRLNLVRIILKLVSAALFSR